MHLMREGENRSIMLQNRHQSGLKTVYRGSKARFETVLKPSCDGLKGQKTAIKTVTNRLGETG